MKLVQHPNVVRLYEVIDTQTKLYLILELGDGGDLYDYIMKQNGGLSEVEASFYFAQVHCMFMVWHEIGSHCYCLVFSSVALAEQECTAMVLFWHSMTLVNCLQSPANDLHCIKSCEHL